MEIMGPVLAVDQHEMVEPHLIHEHVDRTLHDQMEVFDHKAILLEHESHEFQLIHHMQPLRLTRPLVDHEDFLGEHLLRVHDDHYELLLGDHYIIYLTISQQ